MAEGSEAWAVNAPAKPIPLAPCSKMAKPAAPAGGAQPARATAVRHDATQGEQRVSMGIHLPGTLWKGSHAAATLTAPATLLGGAPREASVPAMLRHCPRQGQRSCRLVLAD